MITIYSERKKPSPLLCNLFCISLYLVLFMPLVKLFCLSEPSPIQKREFQATPNSKCSGWLAGWLIQFTRSISTYIRTRTCNDNINLNADSISFSSSTFVAHRAVSFLGLILIGFGTGGIKPCVVSFGADQFVLPQQRPEMSTFFGIFYASINFGSMISTILTPIFRKQSCFGEDECYSLAFGVPALLMMIAIGE